MSDSNFAIYIGFDWATQLHHVWADDEAGAPLGDRPVVHSGAALAALCDWLLVLSGGSPCDVHVAIEVPHGSVVETLMDRGFSVYSINPKQLDRFRDRFTVSGVKDDRQDARVLASSLRTDRRAFRKLEPVDPLVIQLREWSRIRDDLLHEHVKLTNRMREQLRRYYPQFLDSVTPLGANWTLELWTRVPSSSVASKTRARSIEKILKANRIRKVQPKALLEVLRTPGPVSAEGTEQAARAHIALLCERTTMLNTQIKEADKQIKTLILEHMKQADEQSGQEGGQRDAEIISTMPGIGSIVLATLLVEAWRPLRDRDYQALRSLAGIAPVTRRSGKKILVVMRKGCNGRLRNALYHWGRVAAQRDPLTKAKYAALRARGMRHGQALRSVVDRLLGVLFAMLKNQTPYSAAYQNAAA